MLKLAQTSRNPSPEPQLRSGCHLCMSRQHMKGHVSNLRSHKCLHRPHRDQRAEPQLRGGCVIAAGYSEGIAHQLERRHMRGPAGAQPKGAHSKQCIVQLSRHLIPLQVYSTLVLYAEVWSNMSDYYEYISCNLVLWRTDEPAGASSLRCTPVHERDACCRGIQ